MKKVCEICGKEKPLSEFSKSYLSNNLKRNNKSPKYFANTKYICIFAM